MTNEELIETVLKVLQVQKQYGETTNSETDVADTLNKHLIEWGNWKEQTRNQPGLNIDYFHKKVKTLIEENEKLARQLGNVNIRVSNLEKNIFEILPEADEMVKEISKRKTAQLGKKRGPYKKRKKESGTVVLQVGPPTTDNGSNVFGAKTTSKYNKAISRALNSLHFTKQEIIAEVRSKHAKIHRFAGKELLYQVRKAKWRLDGRRRSKL